MKSLRKSMKSRSTSKDKVTTSPLLAPDGNENGFYESVPRSDSRQRTSSGNSTAQTSPTLDDVPMVSFEDEKDDVFIDKKPDAMKAATVQKWAKVVNAKRKDMKKMVQYGELPFQKYEFLADKQCIAKSKYLPFLLLLAFIILPSPIVAVVVIIHTVIRYRKQVNSIERQSVSRFIIPVVITIIYAVIKDAVVVATVLYKLSDIDIDPYLVVYAIVMLIASLLFFIKPINQFVIMEGKYSYGLPEDDKGRSIVNKFSESSDEFLTQKFPLVHTISGWLDEPSFARKGSSTCLCCLAIVFAVLLVLVHATTPWILTLQLNDDSANTTTSPILNSTLAPLVIKNGTSNSTQTYETIVVAISSVTSAFIGLGFSLIMIWILLWQNSLIHQWDTFNEFESNDKTTCLEEKWDSSARWWRTFQMLNFFSCDETVLSNLLRKRSFTLLIILSLVLLSEAAHNAFTTSFLSSEGVFLLIMDAVVLFIGLVMILRLSQGIEDRRRLCVDLLSRKHINISYETIRISHDDNDSKSNDLSQQVARMKQKNLRGTNTILQTMIPDVKNDASIKILFIPSHPLVYLILLILTSTTVILAVTQFRIVLLTGQN